MSIYLHFTSRKILKKKNTKKNTHKKRQTKITRSPDTNIPESTWEYKINNNNSIYIYKKIVDSIPNY